MTKIFKISFLILLVVIVSSYYGENFVLADNNPIVNSENGSDNNFNQEQLNVIKMSFMK